VQTIVVGYDGTSFAERALGRAVELARAFGARVVVVSVAAPQSIAGPGAFGLMPYYTSGAADTAAVLEADQAIWQQHRTHVEELLSAAGIPVEFAGVLGPPADEIVDVAEQHDADLIVVGTRAPGFVERLLGGSVSQGVARRAHCDVLIVHAPEDGAA
jgi:nucleotide-binding universal stress UspA family protein